MASDSTLDTMVNAIAEQVMAKVKTALSHLVESGPRVQPALLNVKEAAIDLHAKGLSPKGRERRKREFLIRGQGTRGAGAGSRHIHGR